MQFAAVEYLNISGLVIDFATSPVRTGNSFFGYRGTSAYNRFSTLLIADKVRVAALLIYLDDDDNLRRPICTKFH